MFNKLFNAFVKRKIVRFLWIFVKESSPTFSKEKIRVLKTATVL